MRGRALFAAVVAGVALAAALGVAQATPPAGQATESLARRRGSRMSRFPGS